MDGLFVLSRTWGYIDTTGRYRTQGLDGNYINKLRSRFTNAVLAMVVVNPAEFTFVRAYAGHIDGSMKVVPLHQSVRGRFFYKVGARVRNLLSVAKGVSSASHVAVFMSSLSAVWAVLLAKLLGKKIFLYSGNDWAVDTDLNLRHSRPLARRLGRLVSDQLETLVLRAADLRLINSPQLFEKCKRMPGRYERVRPVSHFRLTDLFVRDDTCGGERIRIAYPAAIIPRKNHRTLFRALSKLRDRGVNADLWLAGAFESEQIRADLEKVAIDLGIVGNVHFSGYLADKRDMLEWLRQADIFVLSSLNEGFPRVVWEAMLQSLPCAISRIPNIVAEIGNRCVAVMFDPQSDEEIAASLYRIITDRDLRRRLIQDSRSYARSVFAESWDRQLARIILEWA